MARPRAARMWRSRRGGAATGGDSSAGDAIAGAATGGSASGDTRRRDHGRRQHGRCRWRRDWRRLGPAVTEPAARAKRLRAGPAVMAAPGGAGGDGGSGSTGGDRRPRKHQCPGNGPLRRVRRTAEGSDRECGSVAAAARPRVVPRHPAASAATVAEAPAALEPQTAEPVPGAEGLAATTAGTAERQAEMRFTGGSTTGGATGGVSTGGTALGGNSGPGGPAIGGAGVARPRATRSVEAIAGTATSGIADAGDVTSTAGPCTATGGPRRWWPRCRRRR